MQNDNSLNKWLPAVIIIIAILIGVIFMLPKGINSKYKNLDEFAKCLTEKGVKMYGAYWCSHCKEQKAMFGRSVQYVNYVECTEDVKTCEAEKIQVYPTWKIASTTVEGVLELEKLSEMTGCVLEKNE